MRLPRREPVPFDLPSGERMLAWASTSVGAVVGTRDALHIDAADGGSPLRIPWEQVQAADWDQETSVLQVSEVGTWGEVRPEHALVIEEPGRLLELVRERVTASVLMQRHAPVAGRQGVRVIARRSPGRGGRVLWIYEYDEGIDPEDPDVRRAAAAALSAAQDELGGL